MGRKSRLVAAHAEAVEFYHRALVESPDGQAARAYLSSRGVDRAVAERFRLGWAPGRVGRAGRAPPGKGSGPRS